MVPESKITNPHPLIVGAIYTLRYCKKILNVTNENGEVTYWSIQNTLDRPLVLIYLGECFFEQKYIRGIMYKFIAIISDNLHRIIYLTPKSIANIKQARTSQAWCGDEDE